ncbi:hypothetical protein B0H14DRAFT_2617675 [Mycena olivaceomarginata]|nr:hypothetical protein B0H14DRAFT_2617675 [Mycena olivaceomarginata]
MYACTHDEEMMGSLIGSDGSMWSPICPRGWTEGRTKSSGGLRPEVGTRSQRYDDVPRRTRGNGKKAVKKNAAIDELRNNPGEGLPEPWKWNQSIWKAEPKRSSRVGRRSWRYSDGMRGTRGNGWKATGKDTAMNVQRNDPGEGLLELWERSQGIQMNGAKADGVWRWTEFRSSRVNQEQRG